MKPERPALRQQVWSLALLVIPDLIWNPLLMNHRRLFAAWIAGQARNDTLCLYLRLLLSSRT